MNHSNMPSDLQQKFLERVKGPVFPIPTAFDQEGIVDFAGMEEYVRFLLDNGAQTLMVTVGTSRFDLLTVDEMKAINEIVVRTAKDRALTILTTPTVGPTFQAVEFARHAEEIGADGILAVFPDRYYCDEAIYQFFKKVAGACRIGVLIHEMPITAGRGGIGTKVQYSPSLISRMAEIDNIVGLKEESHDPGLIYELNRRFTNRFLIIGGAGGMRAYMAAHHWGQPAYLTSIGNIEPGIEFYFFKKLQAREYEDAERIVMEKESPFFKTAVAEGWHLALKAALDIKGLMPGYERAPLMRPDMDARERINHVMQSIDLI